MKTLSSNNKLLGLFLFILLFKYIINEGCYYKKNKEDTDWTVTDKTYLNGLSGDSAKQVCFALSDYKNDGQCCYEATTNECFLNSAGTDTSKCPTTSSAVFNNCGMAGIYEPVTSETCTEIALVQGYCCFVKISGGHTACIRTKELNKNKNSETDQILNYVKKNDENLMVESVICSGYFLKFHLLLIILSLIIF